MTFTRIATSILLVLCFCALLSCSDFSQTKETHYNNALEYLQKNDSESAIIELKTAIQLDAKYADARHQLGLLYLKAGNPKAAFDELQRAASLDPKNLDAGVKVAEFHLLSHQKGECRKYVKQVLSIDPYYQDGLALLANLELIEGNFAKAEEAIDKAITQAPKNDKFYNIKGRILLAQKKLDESEKLFKEAISFKPDNFSNYVALLMFYKQKKDQTAVQNLLESMLPKFPDNPQLHLLLADFYQQQAKSDKAESEILKAVEIKKDSVPLRLMLADFYKNHQLFDKAEATLKSALTESPDDIQLQVAFADLSFDLQKFDQARETMETSLASNPGNRGANLIKARFLIKDGKNSEALQIITLLTTDYPKWADPFFYSALIQLRLGKTELAQKAIEQALQNNSNSDRFHSLAAQIQLALGNSSEAGKEAALAIRINKHNSIAVKILAKSFVQAKEFDKAVKFIESLKQEAVAGDVELLGTLGIAYIGKDEKEKARQTFAALLKLAPDNSKALAFLTALTVGDDIPKGIEFIKKHIAISKTAGNYLLLGELLTKNKQYQEALDMYRKVQELAPDNSQGYILSARLLSHLGKIDQTIAQYEELLKTNPDSIAAIMGLAAAYEVQGKMDKAKENYTRALQLNPDLPAAANNLAWLLASEDGADLGEALRLAMHAKQAFPDQPNISDTLGWVHYKRKSYSLAISQFKQALENRADDPVIAYHLALALYGNGAKQEAIETLEKVLAGNGKFEERGKAEELLKEWKREVAG